jgi:hypothetical protein
LLGIPPEELRRSDDVTFLVTDVITADTAALLVEHSSHWLQATLQHMAYAGKLSGAYCMRDA